MSDAGSQFTLDPRLVQDTYALGQFDTSYVLLMRNALFPWFIVVPQSNEIELYQLPAAQQSAVLRQINAVSRFIDEHFAVDKLNIGAIGNLVPQLHIHIVGRNCNDACWPSVVWGVEQFKAYTAEQVAGIKDKLKYFLQDEFIVNEVS